MAERTVMQRSAKLARATQVGDEDLALINVYALRPLLAADIIVRDALVVNDQPDSYNTQFTALALAQIAAMLPGSPVLRNHSSYQSEDLPIGIWFKAWVEVRDNISWVAARFFMIREPLTESIAMRMDGGIIREVSLSWWMDRSALQCSICGNYPFSETCDHMPGEAYGERTCVTIMNAVESVEEASLVWKGGQLGTSIEMPDADDMQAERATLMQRIAGKRKLVVVPPAPEVEKNALEEWWDNPHPALRAWFTSSGVTGKESKQ